MIIFTRCGKKGRVERMLHIYSAVFLCHYYVSGTVLATESTDT